MPIINNLYLFVVQFGAFNVVVR